MKKLGIFYILFFSLLGVQLDINALEGEKFEFSKEFIDEAQKDYQKALNETTIAQHEADMEEDPLKKEKLEEEFIKRQEREVNLKEGIEKYKKLEKQFNTATDEAQKSAIVAEAKGVADKIVTLKKDVEELASLVEVPIIIPEKPELSLAPQAVTLKNKADFVDLTNSRLYTKLGVRRPFSKDLIRLNRLAEDLLKIAGERAEEILGDQYNYEWLEATNRLNPKLKGKDKKLDSGRLGALEPFRKKVEENNKSGVLKNASLESKNQILKDELEVLQKNYKKVMDTIDVVNKLANKTSILPDSLEEAFFPKEPSVRYGSKEPGGLGIGTDNLKNFNKITNVKISDIAKAAKEGTLPKNYYDLSTLASDMLLAINDRYAKVLGKEAGAMPDKVNIEIRKIKRLLKDPTTKDAYAYASESFYTKVAQDKSRLREMKLTSGQLRELLDVEFEEMNKKYASVIEALRKYDKQFKISTNLPDRLSVKTLENFSKGITGVDISGPPGG